MITRAVLALLIVFAGAGCGGRHDESRVVDTTLCSVGTDAASYDGVRIRVSAHVLSDGIEHTLLFDPSCSGTKIVVVPGPSRETDINQLKDAIFGNDRGTLTKDVSGTFVGTFRSPNRIELHVASQIVVRRHEAAKPTSS
jgi:hypothetical protein